VPHPNGAAERSAQPAGREPALAAPRHHVQRPELVDTDHPPVVRRAVVATWTTSATEATCSRTSHTRLCRRPVTSPSHCRPSSNSKTAGSARISVGPPSAHRSPRAASVATYTSPADLTHVASACRSRPTVDGFEPSTSHPGGKHRFGMHMHQALSYAGVPIAALRGMEERSRRDPPRVEIGTSHPGTGQRRRPP
jgi:hypothetical protein